MNDAKQFFNDLYRDLSDRRLLVPAIALAVAILAVPILLKSSPAATPPPAAAVVAGDASEVESAVLVADPGIRDYGKRLEALKKKNPFVQQFADAAVDPTEAGIPTEVAGTAGATVGTHPDPTATGAGAAPASPPTTVPGSGGDPPDGGYTGPTTEPTTEPTSPTETSTDTASTDTQNRFYAPRVDVTFGELGSAKRIRNVRNFDFLPNEKHPVVAFLGLGESAGKAVFAVSNEVIETSGQGSCSPHEADGCDLLILRVGQQRTFKVEPRGPYGEPVTYRLKLLDTHFMRIPDPRDDESGE